MKSILQVTGDVDFDPVLSEGDKTQALNPLPKIICKCFSAAPEGKELCPVSGAPGTVGYETASSTWHHWKEAWLDSDTGLDAMLMIRNNKQVHNLIAATFPLWLTNW